MFLLELSILITYFFGEIILLICFCTAWPSSVCGACKIKLARKSNYRPEYNTNSVKSQFSFGRLGPSVRGSQWWWCSCIWIHSICRLRGCLHRKADSKSSRRGDECQGSQRGPAFDSTSSIWSEDFVRCSTKGPPFQWWFRTNLGRVWNQIPIATFEHAREAETHEVP